MATPDPEDSSPLEPPPSEPSTDPADEAPAPVGDGEDGRIPRPPKAPVPADDARAAISDPMEQTGGTPGQEGTVGPDTLSRFLTFYPGMRLFSAIADRRYPDSKRPDTRFDRHRQSNPHLYALCVTIDVITVIVATTLLLAGAAVALYKTLWL